MTVIPSSSLLSYFSISFTDKLLVWTLCATFFFIPIGTAPTVIASLIFLGIWLLSGRFWVDKAHWLRQSWIIPVTAIIVLQLVSLVWSPSPDFRLAARCHYYIFAFAAASATMISGCHAAIARAFLTGLGINVVISILQFMNIIVWHHPTHRYGFMGYITYSLLVVAGMMIVSFLYKESHTKSIRAAYGAALLILLFNLSILEGRCGYLAFLVALPFMLINICGRFNLLRITILALLTISVLAASSTVRTRSILLWHDISDLSRITSNDYRTESVGIRLHLWKSTILIVKENPLLGVGTGGFYKSMESFKILSRSNLSYSHPHNSYLYILVSYGAVGFMFYVWLVTILLRTSWQNRNSIGGYSVFSFLLVILIGSISDTQIISNATGILFGTIPGLLAIKPGTTVV